MFTSTIVAALALSASAFPLHKRDAAAPNDTQILNYALTLEHLEAAFYKGGLEKYDAAAFTKAGLPAFARGRFEQIAAHEAAHVEFLSAALGSAATKPCNYSFPYTDPKSFAALSQALEGTGVSAYLGAAKYISDKTYLTAAASVLSTESRHAAFVAGAVNKLNPWSGAFDSPLSLNQVYTIASAFITSCPSTNPALPVAAFPALTFPASAKPGATVKPKFNSSSSTSSSSSSNSTEYVAFFTGLTQIFAPLTNSSVKIPANLTGTVYAVITNSSTNATDANIVAGPAVLTFSFPSSSKKASDLTENA
ncbi:hypothetical protein PLICRDRAFT_697186 [Plicaturopsis crispa FD-325 SS-3]|nr:hypothetical protein PLICRDRAFT_697186 [Plicaturopsis crispa FD-325 SS-3]